jgi:Domain of unknown function (DUF5666)
MRWVKQGLALRILLFLAMGGPPGTGASLWAQQATVARQVGVIKNINGNSLTLTTDQGTDLIVQVASNAAMVRVAPGQTDLKNATPIQLSDLHVGDRILVRGQPSSDAKSFVAVGVISMSRSDVEAKQRQDREDWQRGIGGLVNALDPTNRTITISVAALGGAKTVMIQTTAGTVLRRYPPDSIQFDEAKPAPFDQIRPGDQLRARGTRSADGSEFTATEIVSGSFRNISGTIRSVDQNASTLTVMDLATKKPFLVKVTAKSQLRSLPPEMAQRLAFRLKAAKGGTPNANSGEASPAGQAANANGSERPAARPGGGQGGDFQQIVNRTQTVALTDFKKDDAVMIVATEGSDSGQVTAITVLGGVEPILAAAPAGSQEMALSPWSLGGSTGEDSP